MEVLRLISIEKTTLEIAQLLFISLDTVKSHRKRLFRKMRVRNSAGLVRKGFENQILSSNSGHMEQQRTINRLHIPHDHRQHKASQ